MYKVFFVEDETLVRKLIRDTIDWEAAGLSFCGEAGDGETALPMILKEKPDILVTDIKMPFMDGLELTRIAKKELPNLIVIILSGFSEFAYAQHALKLNVNDYILKPVTPQKLVKALLLAVQQLESKQDELRKQVVLSQTIKPKEEVWCLPKEQQIEGSVGVDRELLQSVLQFAGEAQAKDFAIKTAQTCIASSQGSKLFFSYCVFDAVTTAYRAAEKMKIELPPQKSFENITESIHTEHEFAELMDSILCKIIEIRRSLSDRATQIVSISQDYIKSSFQNPNLSLCLVAEHVCVSPNYLSNLFSREIGETFSSYLNKVRIQQAMISLKSTDEKVSIIAEQVGYNDQQYFSRIFKKMIGITPREYRKM